MDYLIQVIITCLSPSETGVTACGKQKLLGNTIALQALLGIIVSPSKKLKSPPL